MQNPPVALIIPIYNVKDYLKECLDSVLHQTYQNLQIILVDDASNDGSFEIAKEYFQKDLRITLLCHKQNLGLSASRNTGLDYLFSKQALENKKTKGEEYPNNPISQSNVKILNTKDISTSSGGGGQKIEKIAS